MPQIKVLVVDDSAFMRQVIAQMLESDPDIVVIGVARDGADALTKLSHYEPDVITLDLEMPKMDGLVFLSQLMRDHPVPVVIVSSWAKSGAAQTMRALELGAVDFITKPVAAPSEEMYHIAEELIVKVKTAAIANLNAAAESGAIRKIPAWIEGLAADADICCLAASTGGPRALQSIVTRIPADFPMGLLLVQHMPKGFTQTFANRLGELTPLAVREAADGDAIEPGTVLIAPAGLQTQVTGSPGRLRLKVGTTPASVFKPSADITFASIAKACDNRAMGVVLTGMGQDGAKGLAAMRQNGAHTIVEAAESCVIHGMPKAAAEAGAAEIVLPLWQIPEAIVSMGGGCSSPRAVKEEA